MTTIRTYITLLALAVATVSSAEDADSISKTQVIEEVVITSAGHQGAKRSSKGRVASIDEHLSLLSNVNLVRRGAYACEPVVNNMSVERVSTTIDGMKIFYACTDKMDPVTSYVESGNLQSISLNSGLYGNPQSTGNIGGSIDLKLQKAGFDTDAHHINASAGVESNGWLQVYGADASFSSHRFYTNFGTSYRHAGNYKAGENEEVSFSQFKKVNAFANLGFRLTERQTIEETFIYDRASDVGYPALNMDVAKAEGFIGSVSHKWIITDNTYAGKQLSLETKAYYNHITHVMDDTHRPNVEIHMDMPGRSWTSGIYSLLSGRYGRHEASANYDLYYNRRYADMTMYPGEATPMHMVTWADIGTLNTGLALADNISLPYSQTVRLSAKLSWQQQKLNNDEGYRALKVFFPVMTNSYQQITGRASASYSWQPRDWTFTAGTGWGSRAPTITEAYGYYLNNTFDQYDYIGNPLLKNESAVELNGSIKWQPSTSKYSRPLTLSLNANAFFFTNYIIGKFEDRLSPMTVGAEGVKVYQNISSAHIVNTSLSARWQVVEWLSWNTRLSYAIGRDEAGDNLPLISPLAYTTEVEITLRSFKANISLKGNSCQTNYGKKYGEQETPAFAVINLGAQRDFQLSGISSTLRIGVENLLGKYYASYSDWNSIPQKGRNIFASIEINL